MNAIARNPDIEDLVRQRAHKIWEDEGRPEGRSDSHWRQAQDELQRELAEAKPHPEIATALEPEVPARHADSGAGDVIPDSEPVPEVDPIPGTKASKAKARTRPAALKKPRK